jgi:hypothetical protein
MLVPSAINALTNGPVQQEFTSFEPVDVSDLVNLPTGDFTYVLPIGEVKGPAGVGYPLALSYHAGILNDQEATWVGLGWSLNVGAINRAVRGFPDDYSGDLAIQYVHDNGDHGWNLDVGGGFGPIAATVGFSYSGKGGFKFDGLTSVKAGVPIGETGLDLGFSVNLRSSNESVSVGLNYANNSIGGGVGFTYGGDGMSYSANVSVGENNSSMATFSLSSSGGIGMSVGSANSYTFGMAYSEKAVFQSAYGFGLTIPIYGWRIDFAACWWNWYYTQMGVGRTYGYLYNGIDPVSVLKTPYALAPKVEYSNPVLKYCINDGTEVSSGLHKNRQQDEGVTKVKIMRDHPNIHIDIQNDKAEFIKSGKYFSYPSQDIYAITGQGIGGIFQPFANRAIKNQADGRIGKINSGTGTLNDPYKYESYNNTSPNNYSSKFHDGYTFRMLGEPALNLIDQCEFDYSDEGFQNIDLENSDPTLANNTYGTKIEPVFGIDSKFPNKLSGFVVTDQQGKTYYYTMPLFSYQEVTYVNDDDAPPVNPGGNVFSFATTHSYNARLEPYATTWLLTAITGPDYIKMRNEDWTLEEKLLPHEGDFGYWVAFRYEYGNKVGLVNGKIEEIPTAVGELKPAKTSYMWRVPYYDNETPMHHLRHPCENTFSSTFGIKELTYLKSIETASEVAFFNTSPRQDGYGVDETTYPTFLPSPIDRTAIRKNQNVTSSNNVTSCNDEQCILIPAIKGDASQRNNCMIIHVSKDYLTSQDVHTLDNGQVLFSINYRGIRNYHNRFNSSRHMRPVVDGYVSILKDYTNSTRYNSSTNRYENYNIDQDYYLTNVSLPNLCLNDFPYAKCFYAEDNPCNPDEILLYVTAYNFSRTEVNSNPRFTKTCGFTTGYDWDKPHMDWWWNYDGIDNVDITGAFLAPEFIHFYKRNPLCRYTKKLDVVNFYSKMNYPNVNGSCDPTSADATEFYNGIGGIPRSYKRVKLDYSYDLAPQTINSKAASGGRLTLNKVAFENGDNVRSSTPPYIFKYQNSNVSYLGFDKVDPWGYRAPDPYAIQSNPNDGVNWNLSSILLPTGGTIDIEYERDYTVSSYSTMWEMHKRNRCYNEYTMMVNDNLDNGGYYIYKDHPIRVENSDGFGKIELNNVDNLVPGMLVIILPTFDATQEFRYGWKIKSIDEINKIVTLDHELPIGEIDPANCPGINLRYLRQVVFLKQKPMYCDGIRVKSISTSTLGSTLKTIYSYPQPGFLNLLPIVATPKIFLTDNWTPGGGGYPGCMNSSYGEHRIISYQPYNPDISVNFNNGNTGVIYPEIEVYSVNENRNKINGSKKYYFWAGNEFLRIGGKDVPMIEEKYTIENNVQIKKIRNRSSLVGMLKKMETRNNDGRIIGQKENVYTFSDQIAGTAGVLNGGMSNRTTDTKPLGLINQRSLTLTIHLLPYKLVDMIDCIPFLTEVREDVNNVKSKTLYGWFNARTGSPLATLTFGSAGTKKLAVDIPYDFSEATVKADLNQKNIYNLQAGNFVANLSYLPNTTDKLGVLNYENILPESIKTAIAQNYKNDPVLSPLQFSQSRYYLFESYKWKGNAPFALPQQGGTNWLKNAGVGSVDKYCRPKTTLNAKNVPTTIFMHPYSNTVMAEVKNADYRECGVFTCDYDLNKEGFFDKENSWAHQDGTPPTGSICRVDNANPHFGQQSLYVKNAKAAARKVAVNSPTAKITWSAWVRPVNTNPIRFAASIVANGVGNTNICYDYLYNTTNGLIADKWQLVKFTIDVSKPSGNQILPAEFDGVGDDGIYIWVGNHPGEPQAEFYIDDIRIYPKNALVTTTYYDQKWYQPILSVDANNNPSQKVEYDEFGRAVRWYKVDKTDPSKTVLLQQKEYYLMGDFYAPNPNKWYKIVPEKDESFCIDIKDASWTDSYPVHLWKYTGADALNQLWKFVPDGGNYKIESKGGGGTAFRLSARNLNDTTTLTIKSTAGGTQLWKLTDAGEGFCRISASTDNDAYIDLDNNDAKYDGKVQIYNDGANTKWKLVEVNIPPEISNCQAVKNGQDVTFSWTGSDQDGDNIVFTINARGMRLVVVAIPVSEEKQVTTTGGTDVPKTYSATITFPTGCFGTFNWFVEGKDIRGESRIVDGPSFDW